MFGFLKPIIHAVPGFYALDNYFSRRYAGRYPFLGYPRGHYHSTLPDIREVLSNADVIFDRDVDLGSSIDLRKDAQRVLLEDFEKFYDGFIWTQEPISGLRFNFDQSYFGRADALILYSMLRHLNPEHVIEVGSGFSSALMLDTNDSFLQGAVRFTFIEPNPERLRSILKEEDDRYAEVVVDTVQNVPLDTYKQLEENDVLFIDSSHVSRIGGDVNHLMFNVLPILNPGVVIHFHDVSWPFEYPMEWVVNGRSWNEAYLLRAFLQYNPAFEIMLFNSYVSHVFKGYMGEKMPLFMEEPGGSIWLRKVV